MNVRLLNHVSVRIRDLVRARAFYEDLLGLAPAPRPDLALPGAWYDVGASQVHLIESETGFGGIDPTGPHFALEVPSVAAAKAELDARGVPYLALGDAQLWLRDPDGNVVELCEPR
jgi:catechol 2,3-dioxygenase-like lactoylglutathione lyase family enzyme